MQYKKFAPLVEQIQHIPDSQHITNLPQLPCIKYSWTQSVFLNRPVTKSQEGLQFVKSSATYERQLSMAETKKGEELLNIDIISFLTTNV